MERRKFIKLSISETDSHAVTLKGVTKSYGNIHALRGIDVAVSRGELVTILGPSGSGKSTLLSIIVGAILPDRGRICFHGVDVTEVPPHKRQVGMVFQRYTLFPNRTVAQNIAFPLEVRRQRRNEIDTQVMAALALVGLTEQANRYPSQISGGQAQRVASRELWCSGHR